MIHKGKRHEKSPLFGRTFYVLFIKYVEPIFRSHRHRRSHRLQSHDRHQGNHRHHQGSHR